MEADKEIYLTEFCMEFGVLFVNCVNAAALTSCLSCSSGCLNAV
jgi:hypothetical protein